MEVISANDGHLSDSEVYHILNDLEITRKELKPGKLTSRLRQRVWIEKYTCKYLKDFNRRYSQDQLSTCIAELQKLYISEEEIIEIINLTPKRRVILEQIMPGANENTKTKILEIIKVVFPNDDKSDYANDGNPNDDTTNDNRNAAET